MANYTRVLLALDFHNDNHAIIEKAKKVAADNGAELAILHVIEPLMMAYAADNMSFGQEMVAVQTGVRKNAQARLKEIGDKLGVADEQQLLREGQPAREVHAAVKEHDIDLIVMGTHGQSGLQLLLGSTANSVLHGVSCDVLTVRVTD
jgi:universal stress protein A